MTHANTIATLVRLRGTSLMDAENAQKIAAEHLEQAADKNFEVQTSLAEATDYSRLLRDLDPEHAEHYQDPDTTALLGVHPVVAALRELADRLAAVELPELSIRPTVEVLLHGVGESVAKGVAAAYAAGAEVQERFGAGSWWLSVQTESVREVELELTVFMQADPAPVDQDEDQAPADGAL